MASKDVKIARMAALFGLEAPKPVSPAEQRRKDSNSREAEAAILYIESPDKFLVVKCKTCSKSFGVNRANIAFCSDDCRSIYLNDVLGLEWDRNARTPADRWSYRTGGQEPLIVPPPLLEVTQIAGLLVQQQLSQQPSAHEDTEIAELLSYAGHELDL